MKKNSCTLKLFAVMCVVSLAIPAGAQTTTEVWPEVSTSVKLNDQRRFYFLATTVRENKEATQIEVGAHFDFYLKPFAKKPNKFLMLRLDESKNRMLLVRVGYR